MRCYRKILHISYKDHATNEEVRAKIQQAIGPHEDLLTIVTRRNLQWYGRASSSSGLAKTILRGTVKGGRRQGRQRKRWDDNIGKWKGLEFGKSQKAVENREKMEKTGCKIICGAPTTLAVKGLMMMMMNNENVVFSTSVCNAVFMKASKIITFMLHLYCLWCYPATVIVHTRTCNKRYKVQYVCSVLFIHLCIYLF